MSSQTTILITGANRGVGRAITTTYLLRPNHTIIALTRDSKSETSQSLLIEPRGENSTIILLDYDASLPTSAETALTALRTQYPQITCINTVIANAGFSSHFKPSLDADAVTYIEHFTVNTLGPLYLFRATLPLLTATTTPPPKFIAISSAAGSTTRLLSLPKPPPPPPSKTQPPPRPAGALPYTTSKCALNHVMAKLSLEYPEVAFGLFTPGQTKTGFGGGGVNWEAMRDVHSVEDVVGGLVRLFDGVGAGEENGEGNGKLVLNDWRGTEVAW